MQGPPVKDQPGPGRRTAVLARKGPSWALLAAFLLNIAGLAMGLSEDGFGWAFQMPWIAGVAITSLTMSAGGLILALIGLLHLRGRSVALWMTLAGTLITGLGALLLLAISLAASASI